MQFLTTLLLVGATTALAAPAQTDPCLLNLHDQTQAVVLSITNVITDITRDDNSTAKADLLETRNYLGALEGAIQPDSACSDDVSPWPVGLTPADDKVRAIEMLRDSQDMLGNIDEAVAECNKVKVDTVFCAIYGYIQEVGLYFSA